ncbi:MAG TPA: uroporphyrinogen-III synthase [Candidatus Sulfotelmatobacter sp.]|nr:uroporphyrinogen-III synthase [Candidatus Sulfotelmatobacter sp.]
MGETARSLAGKRVVVTRAAAQSEVLVQALEEQGAVAMVVPMVAFAPPDDLRGLDEAIRAIGSYEWLFLTSQNALRALLERGEALGIRLEQAAGKVKIAAVGPATADAAEHAGLHVEYVAVKHQGTAMAEELAERVRGKRVLLPRSDRANPELVKKLRELGASVKEVVAYKTVQPDEESIARAKQMLGDGADAVLFFSPSAVHHLQEILGAEKFQELAQRVLFTAIGPVTEKALRQAKIERVAMARDTTVDAVIGILRDYFSAKVKLPAGANPE